MIDKILYFFAGVVFGGVAYWRVSIDIQRNKIKAELAEIKKQQEEESEKIRETVKAEATKEADQTLAEIKQLKSKMTDGYKNLTNLRSRLMGEYGKLQYEVVLIKNLKRIIKKRETQNLRNLAKSGVDMRRVQAEMRRANRKLIYIDDVKKTAKEILKNLKI